MKTRHTPGPWEVFDGKLNVGADSAHMVALALCWDGPSDLQHNLHTSIQMPEAKANARLIAAAPELLAALAASKLIFGRWYA